MVKIARIKTLVPTLFFGYILPTTLAFLPHLPHKTRQLASAISILHPVFLSTFSHIFSKIISDSTAHDRLHNPKADLPYLKAVYFFSGALSSLVWLSILVKQPHELTGMLFRGGETADEFLYVSVSGLIWILMSLYDIKKGGRVEQSWLVILVALGGGLALGGPGAVMAGAWAFRENALARRWVKLGEQVGVNGVKKNN